MFLKERAAVFVDGCFWHGCPIHSNPAKWLKKSSMADCLPFPEASAVRSRLLGEEDGGEHRSRPVCESSIAQSRLARHPHLGA